jgi:DNA-binding IclR family transcriptional regulator
MSAPKTAKKEKVDNAGARRVLQILMAMRGTTFTGVSNIELSKATGEAPPNITRALQVLVDEGFVTRLDNGRYAHSISLLQIAQAHASHTLRLQERMTETSQRIGAN